MDYWLHLGININLKTLKLKSLTEIVLLIFLKMIILIRISLREFYFHQKEKKY